MELKELLELIEKHDPQYAMSDDNRRYQEGFNEEAAITKALSPENIKDVLSGLSESKRKFVEDLYARIA
jgi:hypothetical protein